jgi:hypothetical protein
MYSFIDSNLNPISSYFPWVKDGVQYPTKIFTRWSNSELASVGIYRVVTEDIPTPEGKMISSYAYAIEGDVARATPVFVDIPVVVPMSVSRAQGKAALLSAGLLQATIDYIAGLTGENRIFAELAFNETNEWRRDSPFLTQAATVLGLTETQLDNLFIIANSIIL